jgi:glucose-6-phosphate 1-dehydrogenase
MVQLLSLVAMEPPVAFEADSIRDEKFRVVNSIRAIKEEDIDDLFIRGQYRSGVIDGKKVCGYREESEALGNSNTETFLACKLMIDNWRWKDVPFYLRSGKRLKKKTTEIAITFKEVPHSMFSSVGIDALAPNVLVLKIQPCEGTSLSFQTKRPGSKACMATLTMDYDYQKIFGTKMPESYERLLLDSMVGDQTLFSRFDCVDKSWKYFEKVLDHWSKGNESPHLYDAGSESFDLADKLLTSDARTWRSL